MGGHVAGKLKVILNTHGGRLGTQAKINLIEQGMEAAGLDFEFAPTGHPDHGIELAFQAVQEGCSTVVAAGGDGTINQVVNGMMQTAGDNPPQTRLGIIPLGTANDLSDNLELPRDVTAVCRRIAAGNTRIIDVGRVNGRYFANNSAVGLEPVVTLNHDKMRRIKGDLRYVLAALRAVAKARPWEMRLDWGSGVFEGPVILVSVGNGNRTGGAFYMTPRAKLDDGLLDFVYGMGMSRLRLLTLLPKTFTGKHIHHRMVGCQRSKTLTITCNPPTPIQADGEVFEKSATEIKYEIFPNKLRVIV